jgi:hypothetical protein
MSNWTVGDWCTYLPIILAAVLLALIQGVKDMEGSKAPEFLKRPTLNYLPLVLLILGGATFLARQFGPIARVLDPMSVAPSTNPSATGNDTTKATAQLQSEIANLKQQLAAAQQQARNAPSVPQQQPASPESKMSADEIATKIDIWQSVEGQMNDFTNVLNKGTALLKNWPERLKVNRAAFTSEIVDFRNGFGLVQSRLGDLRATYPTYSDVANALTQREADVLARTIQNFLNAVSSLPSDLPENYESVIRPYAGGLNREIAMVANWVSVTRTFSAKSRQNLTQAESK